MILPEKEDNFSFKRDPRKFDRVAEDAGIRFFRGAAIALAISLFCLWPMIFGIGYLLVKLFNN